jgi:predicted dienelactone hydrolase
MTSSARYALVSAIVALPVLALVRSSAAPPFVLPAPTGMYGVGTTSWHVVDSSRMESFVATPSRREVRAFAWYPTAARPANASATRAPYLREPLDAKTFGAAIRSPGAYDALAEVETHALLDAAPLASGARLPVLLFSHGYTGLVSAYSALLEDLASHGFIVLSIAHPYEAVATSLANGSVATTLDSSGAMRREILDVLAEWKDEDSTMAAVTRSSNEVDQLRILRKYINGVPKTAAVIDRWVKDTKLVLDRWPSLSVGTLGGQLARQADVSRVGVFGHSMGGVVAGQFCIEDSRCRAGLNLDGIPQSGTMIDARMQQPFLMVYSARPGRLGASDAIYRRAASTYYRVDVDSTRHVDFSDMIFWGGPLRKAGASGSIAPVRAAELTRVIVREYFDQELRGKPSPLLSGVRHLPDAHVQIHRRSAKG